MIRDRDTIIQNKNDLKLTLEYTNQKKNEELDQVWR
jgi:hypothetical protein